LKRRGRKRLVNDLRLRGAEEFPDVGGPIGDERLRDAQANRLCDAQLPRLAFRVQLGRSRVDDVRYRLSEAHEMIAALTEGKSGHCRICDLRRDVVGAHPPNPQPLDVADPQSTMRADDRILAAGLVKTAGYAAALGKIGRIQPDAGFSARLEPALDDPGVGVRRLGYDQDHPRRRRQ
jgi:hypothetical protein